MTVPDPESAASPSDSGGQSTRVGLVLTAVTCLVLAIGVSMIRQMSRVDRLQPIDTDEPAGQPATAGVAPAPDKLVLRPVVEEPAPEAGIVPPPEGVPVDLDGDRY